MKTMRLILVWMSGRRRIARRYGHGSSARMVISRGGLDFIDQQVDGVAARLVSGGVWRRERGYGRRILAEGADVAEGAPGRSDSWAMAAVWMNGLSAPVGR